jgi:hypothetical protein
VSKRKLDIQELIYTAHIESLHPDFNDWYFSPRRGLIIYGGSLSGFLHELNEAVCALVLMKLGICQVNLRRPKEKNRWGEYDPCVPCVSGDMRTNNRLCHCLTVLADNDRESWPNVDFYEQFFRKRHRS